ncbi:hypothetical protein KHA94_23830 [Bacillus sp. FJAT-49705]|uniref:Lipoprotein n=1 Tax=Cytobacillus citreus TaxID=2833586 RepID=A0ABS5NZ77_9BACI|nr:hypothetical protein [Cytobacillus citreus]MBS4193140.1 hypothetical protein [Cytobacillus citreus]
MRFFLLLFVILLFIAGCSTKPKYQGYLTKDEVLEIDSQADLFVFEGKTYKTGIDWVNEEELTKKEQVGEITEEMANKLPYGAKIYSTNERNDILIVEHNKKEYRYLVMVGE